MEGIQILEALMAALANAEVGKSARRQIYDCLLPTLEEVCGDEFYTGDFLYRDQAFDDATRELHPEWYSLEEVEEEGV